MSIHNNKALRDAAIILCQNIADAGKVLGFDERLRNGQGLPVRVIDPTCWDRVSVRFYTTVESIVGFVNEIRLAYQMRNFNVNLDWLDRHPRQD